jgi:2-polyprenyl-3-methyl-5-hydroxy-6-metoxy-1,4-benzoquinol methylase
VSTQRKDKIRDEFRRGKRFRFGKNWQSFLSTVDERSIKEAERRLIEFLGASSLGGKTFLDVGSGSGLHSLAACRLGAQVLSFDYDPASVEATLQLRSSFGFDDDAWTVQTGSVLDNDYLGALGQFDIVYSWGVLHHTGAMWEALGNVQPLVKQGGTLYIAIYNDSGDLSRWWLKRKKTYCSLPVFLRPIYFIYAYAPIELRNMSVMNSLRRGRIDQLPRKLIKYIRRWKDYKKHRGMNRIHDMVDWIGGYPYEFANTEDLVSFYQDAGFELVKLARNEGTGNHELVFVKGTSL